MSKVPVIVLSGFLGSGKTTLLLRMLQEAASFGLSPAVLMNELGKQDVDGHLLQASSPGINVEKLLDGCMCCSKKSEISDSVKHLLGRKPDVILIELTGVANPEEIVDALTEPALLPYVKLKTVITVLDAEHVLEYNSIFASDRELVHTLRRQMEVADLLLLNKIDLVNDKQRQTIEKTVRKWNERSLLLPTAYSRFDLNLIFGPLQAQELSPASSPTFNRKLQVVKSVRSKSQSSGHTMSYSRIQTVTLSADFPHFVTQRTVERFLTKRGSMLLRAKGYFKLGSGGESYLMQFSGKRTNWQHASFEGKPYLVLIGMDLDAETLEQEWHQHMTESSF
ncbi:CobW family GTP-binding protein [Paenibacillus sedimenti]|uniref:CobW family GTP-binding protein n=1 Tax=Paenibacillus sedimenti TaxID=2770274 RepID=UPI0028971CED|nr:GTP-binding protein [Paenibacillus sedimenti]